jgi:hypothetical protein
VGRELGFVRFLVAVYAVFAISATARSLFQLVTKFEEAPLAYSLSMFAAVVYIAATILLANQKSIDLIRLLLGIELAGVLVVGALSSWVPELFPEATVWSQFGLGYGFVPLVLPILGLVYLRGRS